MSAIKQAVPPTPQEAFETIWRLRQEARDEIYRLIRFLDESDDHMEREPEDEGDQSDLEASLGSFDRITDQSKAWQQRGESRGFEDLELDHAESEPSLGSVGDMHFNQERWAAGGTSELELDRSESGIADGEGLLEQIGSEDWRQGGMF